MLDKRLTLTVLPGQLAVCRLAPDAALPDWAQHGPFFAITRTNEELSLVCSQEAAPPGTQMEGEWRALKVEGPLDFALTGILARLASTLAEANISVFAISTYDTDYLLVRSGDLPEALAALQKAGYRLTK